MSKSHKDAEAAVLLVHVINMSEEEWKNHNAIAMVAAICGWEAERAALAVQRAEAQMGLPPESDEPTDADIAEMLISVAANEPPGLNYERLLATLRRWPLERARRALTEATRGNLLRHVTVPD